MLENGFPTLKREASSSLKSIKSYSLHRVFSSWVQHVQQGIIQKKSASGGLMLPLVIFGKKCLLCYFKVFVGKTMPKVPFLEIPNIVLKFQITLCKAILSSNWKNNTILTVSKIQNLKIQAMKKLNNPSTTLLAGLFLAVDWFNLPEWWQSHKNKKNLLPFLFYLRNLFHFCDFDYSVQIWRFKLQNTLHLKSLNMLLIFNVFLTVM